MFLFRYNYNPYYKLALKDASNTLYTPYRIRQAARSKKGLWWTATANTMRGEKGVVRSWAQRRVRVAFVKALKSQGWDREGKVIAKPEPPGGYGLHAKREKRRRDLKGTLQIHTMAKIVQATGEEVQREAEILVDIIAQRCGAEGLGDNQKAAGSIA